MLCTAVQSALSMTTGQQQESSSSPPARLQRLVHQLPRLVPLPLALQRGRQVLRCVGVVGMLQALQGQQQG